MTNGLSKEVVSAEITPKTIGLYSAGLNTEHFLFSPGPSGLDQVSGSLAMSTVIGWDGNEYVG